MRQYVQSDVKVSERKLEGNFTCNVVVTSKRKWPWK